MSTAALEPRPYLFALAPVRKSRNSRSMLRVPQVTIGRDWIEAQAELGAARRTLAAAPAGIARQAPFDRVVTAGQRCTEVIHEWLASSFELDRVAQPRMLLSLDVDGVL